ncbi:hypothetical protein D6D19_02734 [Aureobasidium pullulans]|uniref:Phosphagen kinase N-terminal domain-containing protein n=1 Tax=Aureobasidium pullulans TaxID=5580 RepID=A0A4S9ACP9_AURPU|nr:hypothetical protein D6D19_02734 [Aureobasidium pullulans]
MPPKKRTSDASAPTPQAKTRKSNSGATLPDAASKTTTIAETSTTADAATTATLEAFQRRLDEKLNAFHNTSTQHANKLEQIHDKLEDTIARLDDKFKAQTDELKSVIQTLTSKGLESVADPFPNAARDNSVEILGDGNNNSNNENNDHDSDKSGDGSEYGSGEMLGGDGKPLKDDELSDEKLRDDPHTFIVMCVPLFEYEERYKKEHKTNFRHPSQDDMPKEEWYRLCDAQDERKANVRREWADTHNSRQCACFNPSNEKNRWFMTRKGKYRMVEAETREIPHRDAEAFGLSVYTDNRGYSYQEIIENDLLEFSKINNKRDGKTEELWSIMEGLTLWINKDNADDIAFTWANLEDGARWNKTIITMGYAFLAVLNRIDREGEFKADSKYKNLSLMLALWYKFAWNYDANITDEFDEDTDYGEEKEGDDHLTKYQHVFNLTWPRYLLAMAQQYDVPIAGVTEIEESVKKDLESIKGLKLPKKKVDRFKFKDMLANLKFDYGSIMGGHHYDVTRMTKAARIESSYDGKDPLSAEDIDALKKGGRIEFGYS